MKRFITLLLLCGMFLCVKAQNIYVDDNEFVYRDNVMMLRFPASLQHDYQSDDEGQCQLLLIDEESEWVLLAMTVDAKTEGLEEFLNEFILKEYKILPGTIKKTKRVFDNIPGIVMTFLTEDDDEDTYNYYAITSNENLEKTIAIICGGRGKDAYARAESIVNTISWVSDDDVTAPKDIVDVVSLDDYMAELYPVDAPEPPAIVAEVYDEEDLRTKVYDMVERMPSFPGGTERLTEYLASNVRYPVAAQEYGVEGRVIVSFIVDNGGSIIEPQIMRPVSHMVTKTDSKTGKVTEFDAGELLNAEALRVVKTMPKWVPGKNNGRLVNVRFNLPIIFRLQ